MTQFKLSVLAEIVWVNASPILNIGRIKNSIIENKLKPIYAHNL